MKEHQYVVQVTWTGNKGYGTAGYTAYNRDFNVDAAGKVALQGSADPAFRGDPQRWSPEDMLVASLSACHKLWYLHLCAVNGVNVLAYVDLPLGRMVEGDDQGKGRFTHVLLRPQVTISADSDREVALRLHEDAHHECFIANSVNFPVECAAEVTVG
ncbi:OsmC family protein [Pseudomonas juntendi]|uniref:OsmC family protein n=1 Tax=Pseudomonas juntendi TaxID=2666183 RepID=UPI001F3A5EF2|nr:OsmC family protein [Pseudomonas juntendi]MCO7055388.1 OsmC family protein [Pseudomonas juntendi]UJM13248.1 OsmC family protein [Pseudomonas juntendi]UXA39559.1 OsmC family protein [Pseudomonas juntendi]